MKKSTPGRVEAVLRKYSLQLARQESELKADQVQTVSRLASALNRLTGTPGEKPKPERDPFQEGQADFYESISAE